MVLFCNSIANCKKATAASQQAKAAMDPAATLRIAGEIVQLMISRSRDSNNQASTHRFQGARKEQGEITRETPGSYTKGNMEDNYCLWVFCDIKVSGVDILNTTKLKVK